MSKWIVVKTQAEFNKAIKTTGIEEIRIQAPVGRWIGVENVPADIWVTACDSSQVTACDSSQVTACGSSQVTACDSSQVRACDSSQVTACDSSQVRAYGSSQVTAYGSSQVTAYGSSQVTACDSSQVTACDSSQVTAYGSSQVRAYGSSQVRAYGSSQVRAYGSSQVRAKSDYSKIELKGYAVATKDHGSKVAIKKSKNALVQVYHGPGGSQEWLENYGLDVKRGKAVIFKRVSSDYKTQENSSNETLWVPGTTVTHPNWRPDRSECGEGKFHACPDPALCDQFRCETGDVYVAIEVKVADLHVWTNNPNYPNKVGFREGKVLYVCDRFGNEAK